MPISLGLGIIEAGDERGKETLICEALLGVGARLVRSSARAWWNLAQPQVSSVRPRFGPDDLRSRSSQALDPHQPQLRFNCFPSPLCVFEHAQ